jgi:hypothetical protein
MKMSENVGRSMKKSPLHFHFSNEQNQANDMLQAQLDQETNDDHSVADNSEQSQTCATEFHADFSSFLLVSRSEFPRHSNGKLEYLRKMVCSVRRAIFQFAFPQDIHSEPIMPFIRRKHLPEQRGKNRFYGITALTESGSRAKRSATDDIAISDCRLPSLSSASYDHLPNPTFPQFTAFVIRSTR